MAIAESPLHARRARCKPIVTLLHSHGSNDYQLLELVPHIKSEIARVDSNFIQPGEKAPDPSPPQHYQTEGRAQQTGEGGHQVVKRKASQQVRQEQPQSDEKENSRQFQQYSPALAPREDPRNVRGAHDQPVQQSYVKEDYLICENIPQRLNYRRHVPIKDLFDPGEGYDLQDKFEKAARFFPNKEYFCEPRPEFEANFDAIDFNDWPFLTPIPNPLTKDYGKGDEGFPIWGGFLNSVRFGLEPARSPDFCWKTHFTSNICPYQNGTCDRSHEPLSQDYVDELIRTGRSSESIIDFMLWCYSKSNESWPAPGQAEVRWTVRHYNREGMLKYQDAHLARRTKFGKRMTQAETD